MNKAVCQRLNFSSTRAMAWLASARRIHGAHRSRKRAAAHQTAALCRAPGSSPGTGSDPASTPGGVETTERPGWRPFGRHDAEGGSPRPGSLFERPCGPIRLPESGIDLMLDEVYAGVEFD